MRPLLLASLLALAACNGGQYPGGAQPAADGGVQWADYATGVQARIDQLATSKDCEGLQAEFDAADANNVATMNRLGHNNAKLMAYIDSKMGAAGCY